MSRAVDGHDGGSLASGFDSRTSRRRRRLGLFASSLRSADAAKVLLLVQRCYPLRQRIKLRFLSVCHSVDV